MERNCEACEKYVTSEDGKTKGCSQWYCFEVKQMAIKALRMMDKAESEDI